MLNEEEKKRKIAERREKIERAKAAQAEVDAKSAALAEAKSKTAPAQISRTAQTQGANWKSNTGKRVEESLADYQQPSGGDNNMAKVVANYGKESPVYADMTYDEAMGFATRIVYDDERDKFLTNWQKAAKKKGNKAYMDTVPSMDDMRAYLNSQKPGGVYQAAGEAYSKQVKQQFADEYKSMQTLHTFDDLIDIKGNAVNMNTADMATIVRAIQAEPSEERRKAYTEAMKTLVKTPGNRFYGASFDADSAKTFIDSAALTAEDYKAQVARYAGRFNPLEGHEQENLDEYAYWADKIENGGYSPYVKNAYRRALDAAYRQQMQTDELPDLTNYAPPQREEEKREDAGKGYNWLERLIMGMEIGGDDSGETEPTKEPEPSEMPEPTPAPEESTTTETRGEVYGPQPRKVPTLQDAIAEGWQTPVPEQTEAYGPQPAGKTHPTLSEAMSDLEFAAAYDAAQKQKKEADAAIPAGSIDLTHDPISAAQYMLNGEGDLLTAETQEMLDHLIRESPGMRAILKLDVDATQEQLEAAQGGDARVAAYVDGTRKYWATGDASAIIGSTLASYLALSDSDAFPQELRATMQGALLEIVAAAEDAYRNGEFDYNHKKETLYDAYLRYNPLALKEVRDVKSAVSKMYLEQRERERLAADEAAMNEQALLEQHREQVRSGTYTPEAYEHVIANAPMVTMQSARTDATYRTMSQEIDVDVALSYGTDDGWYNEMADRYLRENGMSLDLYSAAAMQYKDSLAAYEKDLLLSDMRAAKTLGYGSLEEMYSAWGGMDIDKLHLRAEAQMARDAKEVTAEAVAALDAANSTYNGTGKGVHEVGAFGAGVAHGVVDTSGEMLEGIWTLLSISKEDAAGAVYNVRRKFTKAYGPALAVTEYLKAVEEYTKNMPEEHAKAIMKYIDAGYDPFRLGIDPLADDVLLKASQVLDKRAQSISDWAIRTLDKSKGKWFETGSATGSTVTMQAAATLTTIATGNGFIGSMVGYGLPGLSGETKAQLAAGKNRKDALLMGGLRATSDTIANMITSDRFTQKVKGFVGFGPSVALGANVVGDIGASRTVWGMTKRYGGAFLKSAAQQSIEEVVTDPMLETITWQALGSAGEAYIGGAGVVKSVVTGLNSIDVVGAVEQTVKDAGTNFIATLPLAILGGAGDAIGAGRQAPLKASYQVAVELAATGTPEAAGRFVQALANDLDAPAGRDALNQAFHDAAVAQEASSMLLTDEEVVVHVDEGAKAQEQADAHAQSEENSRAAAEAGRNSALDAQERMNAGEVSPELVTQVANGVQAHAKNTQSTIEHQREKEQKQAEADEAFADGVKKATAKAEAEVTSREVDARASFESRRQLAGIEARISEIDAELGNHEADGFVELTGDNAKLTRERNDLIRRRDALRSKIAGQDSDAARESEIKARIDQINEAAYLADAEGIEITETAIQDVSDELEALYEELEEIKARREQEAEPKIDEAAVVAQRAEAEAALAQKDSEASAYLAQQAEREKAQEEADAMLPVYQSLSRKEIYVDDTQRANILSRTGLKTLGQVNWKYGLRLTNDKKKNAPSLDGSTFAELYDLAPGYVAQDVTVAEDALMDIVERKKQLKGMQASVGETAYEKYLPDGTFYGITDPVMQQLFSDVKKTTGVDIVVAPLAGNVRALYDRAENRIIINNRIGAGEISRKVVMHELTHFIEGGAGYEQYKNAVLKAAYAHDKDGSQRKADEKRIFETYEEAGHELDADGLEKELVAEATEKIITDPDGRLTRQLLGQKQKGLLYNLMMKLGEFMARKRAQKSGNLEQYNLIQEAYDRLKEALVQGGGDNQNVDPTVDLEATGRRRGEMAAANADGQMQFSIVRDRSGTPVVVVDEDILAGVPQKEWAKTVKQVMKEKFPNGVTVGKNQIQITKKSRKEITNAKDAMWLKYNQPEVYADKMRAAANADEILLASRDYVNEDPTHERRDDIVDFGRGSVQIAVGGQLYTAEVVVGGKEDGSMILYDFVEMTKKEETQRTGGHQDVPHSSHAASLSDTSVTESTADVNPYSTQNGQQYSLAPNQFGNKTAQELTTIDEAVKDVLMGSKHEIIGNDERLDAAWKAVTERGADVVADELLSMPVKSWGAQENVNAALCAVLASRDGDVVTAATILTRYDREGTSQGQALQARQLIKRLSPEGAMLEMIRAADRANKQKGVPAGSFPTGENAPKETVDRKGEDGSVERTKKSVQKVYHEADELKAELDKLPTDVSYDNPWKLPLSEKQMALIREFGLLNEKLPGVNYNVATKKQRMLAAILAMDPSCEGDGLTTLCQQLTAIQKGYAVVTMADLRYVASQMAEFRAKEGPDATIPQTEEGAHALGRAYQALDNVKTADWLKQWTAVKFANMLSAPATMVRNIAGNVISGGLEDVSTRIASGFDAAIAKKTGTRTTAVATREERKAADAAFRSEIIHTINDYFVDKVDTSYWRRYDVGGKGRVFQPEFFEMYRNMVDFAMQIGDRPFFEQKYAEELAIINRLGMTKTEMTDDGTTITRKMTEKEMHEEATMRALHRVFQEDNVIVKWLNGLRNENPLTDLAVTTLMPFIKTPTNVAMRAIEYSPVGLGATIVRKMFHGMDAGKPGSISQRDYVMGIGRGLTGSGLMVAGWALASAGIIKFGREDEENKGIQEATKAQNVPYGMYIQIGDTMREIDWAMPVASAIAIGADFYKALDDGEGLADAALTAVRANVGGQILDTPMMSAMNDIFRGYDSAENLWHRLLNTGAASLLNQTFSPAILRAFAKATDPYVRDTGADSWLMTTINKGVIQYWPGLRKMLPKATDITGDYALAGGYYSWDKETQNAALHFLDSFFTPTATIGEKNDDALYELVDLAYRTGEAGFLPTTIVKENGKLTINKSLAEASRTGASAYDINLTADERREFNRLYSDILFNGLRGARYDTPSGFAKRHKVSLDKGIRKMMESGEWARMSDSERMDMIADMKSAAKELVSYMAINGEL